MSKESKALLASGATSTSVTAPSTSSAVAKFLTKAQAIKRIAKAQTHIVFSLDATASRAPTWQRAQSLHEALFDVASETSGLSLQLCYFKGIASFYASPWVVTAEGLRRELSEVSCEGGITQLRRLLEHCLAQQPDSTSLKAIIFIGDAVEEDPNTLNDLAVRCRLANRPLYIFQEGSDPRAKAIFASMAMLSGGAHIALGENSADQLRQFLQSVIRLATGGRKALESSAHESDKLLLDKLTRS